MFVLEPLAKKVCSVSFVSQYIWNASMPLLRGSFISQVNALKMDLENRTVSDLNKSHFPVLL